MIAIIENIYVQLLFLCACVYVNKIKLKKKRRQNDRDDKFSQIMLMLRIIREDVNALKQSKHLWQNLKSVFSKVDDKLSLQLQTTHSSHVRITLLHLFYLKKKQDTIEDTKSKIETYGNEEQIQLETGLDIIETDNKTKKQAALEDIESLKDQTADKTKIENVTEEKISETTKTDSNTNGTSTDNTNQVLLVFFFSHNKKKKKIIMLFLLKKKSIHID
ncbi:hypothetical protein RFI_21970 [Reticulomyxa filosa]|uniref:Uncharacterized protein n=1 Tax=Reticulomyxa filosa TaxID=46433 RepID=X6MN50_RETFI|nr:hypothetical protein RFI_21970 [Reticulomyxa filosa]|eukprot:ETO15393.1 hypothetical protein RFI_21970 [Reticulomyxa filosa]